MLPSRDVFCSVSEDSDSRVLPTCLPDSFEGPHPQIFGSVLTLEVLPETSRLPPAPRFRSPFGQHHLEETQKSASGKNCLDPGFHVLGKVFGRN